MLYWDYIFKIHLSCCEIDYYQCTYQLMLLMIENQAAPVLDDWEELQKSVNTFLLCKFMIIILPRQPLIASLQNSSTLGGRLAALAQEQRPNDDDHLPLRGCPRSEAAIPRVCVGCSYLLLFFLCYYYYCCLFDFGGYDRVTSLPATNRKGKVLFTV